MATAPSTTRIALRNILFTTDFSEASRSALPYALSLARCYEGNIFVAHVVPFEPYLSAPLEPVPVDLDLLWNREKQSMAQFVAGSSFREVPHQELLQRGQLWDVISEIIGNHSIDLVVAGTHGRQGLSKVMLGSSAEEIYRRAKCPVLTIGPHVPKRPESNWQLKQIIFATDFSPGSLHALPYALSLAEENQATLIFLHLVHEVPRDDQEPVHKTARQRLEELMPPEPWCTPEFVVRCGLPSQGILQEAQEHEADLIVMGVKKKSVTALGSHRPWSTASDVVSQAPCPVLTVRG